MRYGKLARADRSFAIDSKVTRLIRHRLAGESWGARQLLPASSRVLNVSPIVARVFRLAGHIDLCRQLYAAITAMCLARAARPKTTIEALQVIEIRAACHSAAQHPGRAAAGRLCARS